MGWWYVAFVVTVALFVALRIFVLPKAFLRGKYKSQFADRGLKNVNETEGHSILYAPDMRYRKYLKHYVLSARGEQLRLACDFHPTVRYADYDVSLYDGEGEIFDVLQVKQTVENGVSEPIALPARTAYVSVKLNAANEESFPSDLVEGVSNKNLTLFLLACAGLELAVLFLLNLCIAKLFGGIYNVSYLSDGAYNLTLLIYGLAVVLVNAIVTLIVIKAKNARSARKRGK